MSNNKLAIFLIITSVFFGTVMLSFLKIAQEDVNVYVAGFFRFFLGLVIIRPGFVDISIGVYMVLFSALLWSINIIITKKFLKMTALLQF